MERGAAAAGAARVVEFGDGVVEAEPAQGRLDQADLEGAIGGGREVLELAAAAGAEMRAERG
jgi:hypothetical protein